MTMPTNGSSTRSNSMVRGISLLDLLLDDRERQHYHGRCSQRGIPIMQERFGRGTSVPEGAWLIRYSNLNTFCLTAKASTSGRATSKHTAPYSNGYFHWPFKIMGTHRRDVPAGTRLFILFVCKYSFEYYDNESLPAEGTSGVDEHVRNVYTSFEDFASMCFKHWANLKFSWSNGIKKQY